MELLTYQKQIAEEEKRRYELLNKALEVFTLNGYNKTSNTFLISNLNISEQEFKSNFTSKSNLLNNIFHMFEQSTVGGEFIPEDFYTEMMNGYNLLKVYALRLSRKWSNPEERMFLKFLMKEQPVRSGNQAYTLSYYMNQCRSMWWMIFDEMVKFGVVKPQDPLLLANSFVSPLFMIRVENLLPEMEGNYSHVQDLIMSHVVFFWQAVSYDDSEIS